MLATWQGTAFQVAYLLGSVAGIMIGAVMLRGGIFGRLTARLAILGNAVGLGLYAPTIEVYIAVFSAVFLEVWYVLVARRLLQLGQDADAALLEGGGRAGAYEPVGRLTARGAHLPGGPGRRVHPSLGQERPAP